MAFRCALDAVAEIKEETMQTGVTLKTKEDEKYAVKDEENIFWAEELLGQSSAKIPLKRFFKEKLIGP